MSPGYALFAPGALAAVVLIVSFVRHVFLPAGRSGT
jgi:hypothetical protein